MSLTKEAEEYEPKQSPDVDIIDDPDMIMIEQSKSDLTPDMKSNEPSGLDEMKEEFIKLKDKLLEYEDLIYMYKADLTRLQTRYLEAVEEKEEIKYRHNTMTSENSKNFKDFEDMHGKIKRLEGEKFSLVEEIEAYKSQNNCLKITIRNIQENLEKAEKQIKTNEQLIESIEIMNANLTMKNEELKNEIKNNSHNDIEKTEEVKDSEDLKLDPWGIDNLPWLKAKTVQKFKDNFKNIL